MSTISNTQSSVQVNDAPLTTAISSANSTLLTDAIDARIAKIRPMATPVDQLSRCGDVRHVGSMKVHYYTSDVKSVSTQLTEDIDRDDFTKGSGDGDTGTLKLKVKDAAIFSPTETVLLPEVDAGGSPLMLYLTDVDANSITGHVINELSNFSSQVKTADTAYTLVVRMGRAAGELDVQTPQYETLPKRGENYCQIFKMQIEESTLHRLSNKEARWGFSDQEEVAIIDMRQGMEKNFLFGTRCRLTAVKGKDEIYLTGGIWNQEGVETYNYDPSGFTETDLIGLTRKAFTGGKGSARKILMGGSGFIEALSRIQTTRILSSTQTLVRWGLEFREIKTNFGTLYVIHNEIFDQCGHAYDGMILDPNMLTKYVHVPFSTERLDLRTSGTRNTDAVVLTEASCLVLRNPACHLKIVSKES